MASTNNSVAALGKSIGLKDSQIPDDLSAGIDFDVNNSLLSTHELLNDAGDKAKEMMTGAIPDDLRDQIEDTGTSKAMSNGIGMGEAGRKLVARDLGLTSMEISQQGTANALAVADAKTQLSQVSESLSESRRNFVLALGDKDTNDRQLALMGAEIVSQSHASAMAMVNQLIVTNASRSIDGLQGHVDSLIGNTESGVDAYSSGANSAILDITNLEKYT